MLFETSDVIDVASLILVYATYRQGKDRSQNKEIKRLLREVFFSKKKVIKLVKTYAKGGEPSDEEKATILTEFNDWDLHSSALRKLLNADVEFGGTLSIKQSETLQKVHWNKVQVRQAVQTLLGDGFRNLSQCEAGQVLDNIKRLNKKIKKAQRILA